VREAASGVHINRVLRVMLVVVQGLAEPQFLVEIEGIAVLD
jgi:hypothetical protein